MYLETSGDATFTVLIEGFDAAQDWAKGGVRTDEHFYDTQMHIFAGILTLFCIQYILP